MRVICRRYSMSEQQPLILGAFTRQQVVTAAGLAAAAFVGYCIYFDHKRRSAPDYKQKIRENRRAAARSARGGRATAGGRHLPDVNNPTEMQAFFLQEVQLGEEMMAEGNLDEGTEHLCNAITMCGQPQQLLQIFQQTLPPEHFAMIIQKLPETRTRLARMFALSEESNDQSATAANAGSGTRNLEGLIDNDDLE
uniref:Mitochondrial import receptor subunit TOM20 homolog n=1 Tax=Parascaris univalens TaxID=6257 RepID=A0A915B6I0_PARUN